MLLEIGFHSETKHRTLRSFLDEQSELLTEHLQDEAQNQWEYLSHNADSEDMPEVGRQMKKWWNKQIADFRTELMRAYHRQRAMKLKRQVARQRYQIEQLQQQLEAQHRLLYEAKGDLEIEKGYSGDLREAKLCPECRSPI